MNYLRLTAVFFSALLGGCLGSFLNVAVWRLPAGMSLISPGSFCPKCKQPIRFYDNIPVFGWLLLRGKCRNCHQPISPRYPIIEALVMLIAFLMAYLFFIAEKGVPAGFFRWDGLSTGFQAAADYLSGASFFQAVTPEEILLKGLGAVLLWTVSSSIFLGLGLAEWDGVHFTPLIYGFQLFLIYLLLGNAALIPISAGILFCFSTRFFAPKYRPAFSLVLFFFFLLTFTGTAVFLT